MCCANSIHCFESKITFTVLSGTPQIFFSCPGTLTPFVPGPALAILDELACDVVGVRKLFDIERFAFLSILAIFNVPILLF